MKPAAPVSPLGFVRAREARTRRGRLAERLALPLVAPAMLLLAAVFALAASLHFPTPGTVVTTTTRPGPSQFVAAPGATYFVVGQSERGSTTEPIELRGLSDARNKIGPRVTYGAVDDDLAMFFGEGGGRAFFARVVGAAATRGTLVLVDRAVGPATTLTVNAKSPGAWSSRLKVQVRDGSLGAGTFRLTFLFDDVIVEDWDNLTSPANAVALLNDPDGGSTWVTLVDGVSLAVAPANLPAVIPATPLSAGDDNRGAITAPDYIAALNRFGSGLGDGIVAIPGQPAANVGAGLRAHAKATNRLYMLATAVGQTVAAAKATTVAQRGVDGHENGGLAYPWVYVPDGAGGRRLVSPEGYVAGVRARTHRDIEPWQAPAGDLSTARYVIGVETVLTDADTADLTLDHVLPIRLFPNIGVQLYGWRSLSKDTTNYRMLTGRDVMNRLAVAIKARTDRIVFRNVDGQRKLLERLDAECRAEVEPMAAAGAFWPRIVNGERIDEGFVIDTSPNVNTDELLAADAIAAVVGVRNSATAETVNVGIFKVSLTTAL